MSSKAAWARALRVFLTVVALGWSAQRVVPAQMTAAPPAPTLGTGVLPAAQVEHLLPPSVYFRGQSAPLQLRNAAAFHGSAGSIVWVSLVDTSGYSTGVRERYQFYLVTEQPLAFGNASVPAGAYGGGFLSDGTALLMDPGGHDVATTPTATDEALHRPRPLQLVVEGNDLRLYLGRQYIVLKVK